MYRDCCTISDYQKYLSRYTTPKYKTEAVEKMQYLRADEENRKKEKEKAEREKKRLRDADNSTFVACRSLDDYQAYVRSYPRGIHITEARNAISRIEKRRKNRKRIGIWTTVLAGIALIVTICGFVWGFENVLLVLIVLAMLVFAGIIQGFITAE